MSYHPRRNDREITDSTLIDALLQEGRYCTIALYDGEPYAVTLSYGYDPSTSRLYFHCADEGRKIEAIARNARACASVVLDRGYKHGECAHPYESVVLHGTLRIVQDAEEKLHGLRVLVEQLEDDPDSFARMGLNDPARVDGVTALAFDIEARVAKGGE